MTDTCSLAYTQGTMNASINLHVYVQSLEGSVESKNQALLCPMGTKTLILVSPLEIGLVSKRCTLDGRIVIQHVLS